MAEPIETRRASIADLDTLLAHVQAGFDSYIEFAPASWRPRSVEQDRGSTAEMLSHPETWALLALARERPVGHAAFYPARERKPDDGRHWIRRPKLRGLAHLWQLFVVPDGWGRGIGSLLHDAAIAEMVARGFDHARLVTPSAHARARRFYERRGWVPADEEWNPALQLALTEYRRTLTSHRP